MPRSKLGLFAAFVLFSSLIAAAWLSIPHSNASETAENDHLFNQQVRNALDEIGLKRDAGSPYEEAIAENLRSFLSYRSIVFGQPCIKLF